MAACDDGEEYNQAHYFLPDKAYIPQVGEGFAGLEKMLRQQEEQFGLQFVEFSTDEKKQLIENMVSVYRGVNNDV